MNISHALHIHAQSSLMLCDARSLYASTARGIASHSIAPTAVSYYAAVQDKMASDHMLWAQRPIPEELLRYAAEDVQQLLILADKITVELGTAQLTLLKALSSMYSQSYWDAAHQDAAASCVTSFPTTVLPAKSAAWIADLFHKAHPANPTSSFSFGQSLRM